MNTKLVLSLSSSAILIYIGATGHIFPTTVCPQPAHTCGVFSTLGIQQTQSGSILLQPTDIVREELLYVQEKLSEDPVLSGSKDRFISYAQGIAINIGADVAARVTQEGGSLQHENTLRQTAQTEIAKSYVHFLEKRRNELTTQYTAIGEKIFPTELNVFDVLSFIDGMKQTYSKGSDVFSIENVLPGEVTTSPHADVLPVTFTLSTSYGTMMAFLADTENVGNLEKMKTTGKTLPLFRIVSLKIQPNESTTRTDDVRAEVAVEFFFQSVTSEMLTNAKDEYMSLEKDVEQKLQASPEKKTAEIITILGKIDVEKQHVVQLEGSASREILKAYANITSLYQEILKRLK